jgi:protein-tyrosine phosphatase
VIDLHCHIVPGIDDGAQGLVDSLEMARQGAADGIEVICATPHIRHDHDVRISELGQRVDDLNAELRRAGVRTRVVPGGEVAETILEHCDDDELRLVSLGGGGRWILVEPAPGPLSDSLLHRVEELAGRGFRSVIAHPERHLTPDLDERLAALVERGALVQATADYLVAVPTAPTMNALATRGLIHVLGSDAHSARHGRAVRLSEGVAALRGVKALESHVEWIARTAPAAIVDGEEIDPPYPPLPGR